MLDTGVAGQLLRREKAGRDDHPEIWLLEAVRVEELVCQLPNTRTYGRIVQRTEE